jgi:anaphase-promoting complex subunit 3
LDKFAPETWCVVGNCFSLQHEPETAIKFFQRALQLDPYFSYAHTLCGHEYVANEDLEKAVNSFRHAIRCDDRHYNAWYGLGAVYYRQERLDLAEYHFRRACAINKISSVLQCYMGMVLHAQNNMPPGAEDDETEGAVAGYSIPREEEAFEILRNASHRDPKNPQLHFQMVHVLLSLDSATSPDPEEDFEVGNHVDPEQYREEVAAYLDNHPYLLEALYELHLLEELVPKEPPIFSLLGQIYQHKLNNTKLATKYYNIAIDLDPKEGVTLKVCWLVAHPFAVCSH